MRDMSFFMFELAIIGLSIVASDNKLFKETIIGNFGVGRNNSEFVYRYFPWFTATFLR